MAYEYYILELKSKVVWKQYFIPNPCKSSDNGMFMYNKNHIKAFLNMLSECEYDSLI